jgi:dihydrofolate reductase
MKKSIRSIIVAMDEKRGIGKNNDLLFRIAEDFKRMTEITSGHPIIMGRKTWDSLPENRRPLPRRYNIVITRDEEFKINNLKEGDNFAVVKSLEEGIRKAEEILKPVQHDSEKEIFIFGGGQIFKEAMEKGLVDKLCLTIVEGDFKADTFFPDYSEFKKVVFEKERQEREYRYKFVELKR